MRLLLKWLKVIYQNKATEINKVIQHTICLLYAMFFNTSAANTALPTILNIYLPHFPMWDVAQLSLIFRKKTITYLPLPGNTIPAKIATRWLKKCSEIIRCLQVVCLGAGHELCEFCHILLLIKRLLSKRFPWRMSLSGWRCSFDGIWFGHHCTITA